MRGIGDFLGKFKDLLYQDAEVRHVVVSAVKKIVGVDVSTDAVAVKNAVVTIQGSSMLKNEIFMKKSTLIEEINKSASKKVCDDVR